MKSKTSYSSRRHLVNPTIFKKNITLFWPVWAVYILFWIIVVPCVMWMGFKSEQRNENVEYIVKRDQTLRTLETVLDPQLMVVVCFIMAAFTGMALYNYLFTAKSANWLHSLPVTRMEMFGTNYISGLLFMWIPQFITFLVSVLVCVSSGVGEMNLLAQWFVMSLGISLLFWSMISFCAMFSGQLFALPIYYVALNLLYIFVKVVLGGVISFLGYGISYNSAIGGLSGTWLSPVYFLFSRMGFKETTIVKLDCNYITGLTYQGGKYVLYYAIFAIVLMIAAAVFYKKRNIESAGDLLAFSFVKPIFRWGVGCCGGFGLGIFIAQILMDYDILTSKYFLVIFSILFGVVFFFIAEMFVQKKFKVFGKKVWKECGCFASFIIILYGGACGYSTYMQNYIPEADEVESVSFWMEYEITYSGDLVDEAIEMHKSILENKDVFDKKYEDSCYTSIYYTLKNGKKISRRYCIPRIEESKEIVTKICEAENNPDNFKQYILGTNIGNIICGRLSLYDEEVSWITDVVIDQNDAEIIYEAFLKDIDEGNVQKYNLSNYNYFVTGEENPVAYSSDLSFDFYLDKKASVVSSSDNSYDDYEYDYKYSAYDDYEDSRTIYFSFGPECTNIVNALVDTGVIESADMLHVYPEQW